MSLAQLVYVSRMADSITPAALGGIVARSEEKNRGRDISGALLCAGRHFMQLLEGELADVIELYETIRVDPRHTDVRCLMAKNVEKRIFPDWGMRLLDSDSRVRLDRERLLRLLEEFRVHRTTGARSVEARILLQDFRQQLLGAA